MTEHGTMKESGLAKKKETLKPEGRYVWKRAEDVCFTLSERNKLSYPIADDPNVPAAATRFSFYSKLSKLVQ
jgi:hypothetical protein